MRQNLNIIRTKCLLTSLLVFCAIFAANCSQQNLSNAEALKPGRPVIKGIVNEQVHSYSVDLESGQYLVLAVEQHDVDVITEAYAPGGESIGEFDTPTGGRGIEQIRIVANTAGEYRFDIYTLSERAEPGQYTVEVSAFRPATERDREITAAVKLHQQADKLRSESGTRSDSISVYEKALQIWRDLGEPADEANTLRAMGFAYQRMDEIDAARGHFGQALKIWGQLGDSRSAAFTHVIFGVMSKKQNDYETGLREDLIAQALWEQSGDMGEATQNLVRIGNDYIKLQRNDEAIGYFERALALSESVEGKSVRAYVLSECGNAQASLGNSAAAVKFYRQSIDLWKSLKQDKVVAGLEEKIFKLQTN